MDLLIKGIIVGLSIAAPVGPIGLLCIHRSLAEGRAVGLLSGLGAATADALYGAVAALGLTAVSALLIRERFWISMAGGVFLCYLGVRTMLAPVAVRTVPKTRKGLARAYLSTFMLTLANPVTILSFIAVFAGLGLSANSSYVQAGALILGVFAGSAIWWVFLSTTVASLRERIGKEIMLAINRLSGALIGSLGLYCLYQAWEQR
jgi:threonine/homoserine/homoserine lactone efflux protein